MRAADCSAHLSVLINTPAEASPARHLPLMRRSMLRTHRRRSQAVPLRDQGRRRHLAIDRGRSAGEGTGQDSDGGSAKSAAAIRGHGVRLVLECRWRQALGLPRRKSSACHGRPCRDQRRSRRRYPWARCLHSRRHRAAGRPRHNREQRRAALSDSRCSGGLPVARPATAGAAHLHGAEQAVRRADHILSARGTGPIAAVAGSHSCRGQSRRARVDGTGHPRDASHRMGSAYPIRLRAAAGGFRLLRHTALSIRAAGRLHHRAECGRQDTHA